jgi:hypothetical protein
MHRTITTTIVMDADEFLAVACASVGLPHDQNAHAIATFRNSNGEIVSFSSVDLIDVTIDYTETQDRSAVHATTR